MTNRLKFLRQQFPLGAMASSDSEGGQGDVLVQYNLLKTWGDLAKSHKTKLLIPRPLGRGYYKKVGVNNVG